MNKLDEIPLIKNVLLNIASVFNKNKINWGVGGSLLLYLNGIETTIGDIDLIVDVNDITKLEKIVEKYKHIEKPKTDIFLTERFFSFNIDGVNVDLMIGFKLLTEKGLYSFPIGDKIVDKSIIIDDTSINLCSLKDWLEAYTAMGRKNKIELIKQSELVG